MVLPCTLAFVRYHRFPDVSLFFLSEQASFCLGRLTPKTYLNRGCATFSSEAGVFVGDGFCDQTPEFNNRACLFDGGDCCFDTVSAEQLL